MQADYAVELGREDETLDFPWSAPDGVSRYHDIKRHPELLSSVEEAVQFPELAEFLAAINSSASPLETAKCDAWASTEINPEEEIFAAPWKFGSYVDLLLTNACLQTSFNDHEILMERLTALLANVPDIPAAAEFLLRRCFYYAGQSLREGFYITFYLVGYGPDETKARRQWAIALKLVSNAFMQLNKP